MIFKTFIGLGTFFRRGLAEYPFAIVTEYEILVIDEIQEPLDKNGFTKMIHRVIQKSRNSYVPLK